MNQIVQIPLVIYIIILIMSSIKTRVDTDARGNQYENWVAHPVETPDGVGDIIESHPQTVTVSHEYPTHAGITKKTYKKTDVAIITSPLAHPVYGDPSIYHGESSEDLYNVTEQKIHL